MYDIEEIKYRANGRWLSIANSCGIDIHGQSNKHQPCPICGDGWKRFRFDNLKGDGTWICNHCGAGDGLKLIELYLGGFRQALDFVAGYLGITEQSEIDHASIAARQLESKSRQIIGAVGDANDRYVGSMLAADGAKLIMQSATPAMGGHYYLLKKRIDGATTWVMNDDFSIPTSKGPINIKGSLVIPLINERRELVNCQIIKPDGKFKMFLLDGQITGAFHLHGSVRAGDVIAIGEGFATVDTVKSVYGFAGVSAMNSNNLQSVALIIDYLYPNNRKVIVADNDWHNNDKKCGNAGLIKGGHAAKAIGCDFIYPPTMEDVTDMNDLVCKVGADEARRLVRFR